MTPHQTIAVAVRLFAIWLFVSLITGLLGLYSQLSALQFPNRLPTTTLIALVTLIAVVALWLFPHAIARRLLTTSATPPTEAAAPISADTWLAMGCALLGLWVLAHTLPVLVRELAILYASRGTITDTSQAPQWLLYEFAQIAVALWLIFGAKGFRRVFWWARYAGIGEPSNNRSRGP